MISQKFRTFARHLTVFDNQIDMAEELAVAYARSLLCDAAEVARTTAVLHGDHYASYSAPSSDGDAISRAILNIEV